MSDSTTIPVDLRERLEQQVRDAMSARFSRRAKKLQAPRSRDQMRDLFRRQLGDQPNSVRFEAISDERPKLHTLNFAPHPLPMHLKPADVTLIRTPPYDFDAQNKYCSGQPDQCVTYVVKETGDLNIALHIVKHSADVWGFAGVGSWYQPQTTVITGDSLVEVRSLIHWNYDYKLDAFGPLAPWETAHARAEIGVRVFSWDANGQDQQEIGNHEGLFHYGVNGADWTHEDNHDGQTNVSTQFRLIYGRHYAYCAYFFAACDANGFPSSDATVDVIGNQPWLVTEEWGLILEPGWS
jgi:hypothetical protein